MEKLGLVPQIHILPFSVNVTFNLLNSTSPQTLSKSALTFNLSLKYKILLKKIFSFCLQSGFPSEGIFSALKIMSYLPSLSPLIIDLADFVNFLIQICKSLV